MGNVSHLVVKLQYNINWPANQLLNKVSHHLLKLIKAKFYFYKRFNNIFDIFPFTIAADNFLFQWDFEIIYCKLYHTEYSNYQNTVE